MILLLLAYLGGALTILSPCILPVLPFVFSRADRPFLYNGLPILVGMALSFAGVATLAAVGGGWAVQANVIGRWAAIALLALFGIALLFPSLADRLTQPLVRLGDRLSQATDMDNAKGPSAIWSSLLLGVATGLLWAPCAGPILGLVLTGAALQGANAKTTAALLAYAMGAATSLGLALLVGGRVFVLMKRSLGAGEWIRRGLGVAVLVGVAAIGAGLDAGILTQMSLAGTTRLEQGLIDRLGALRPEGTLANNEQASMKGATNDSVAMNGGAGAPAMMTRNAQAGTPTDNDLPDEGPAPSFAGAVQWYNSPPLTAESLKGKVVLVDFWTYSCINCLREIPYVRAWAQKYLDQGLVVIGVHSPEFAFEKSLDNVKRAIADLKIDYPVAVDNDFAIWRAFDNEYWPALYFIDAHGRVRHHHFGEGQYDQSEKIIQQLLAEAGRKEVSKDLVKVDARDAEAAPDMGNIASPETYIGYLRAENFVSPGGEEADKRKVYQIAPAPLQLNQWALDGAWTVEGEKAVLDAPSGRIVYRFHARDLHLVLGPSADNKPVRFRVLIDGQPPGANHGSDVSESGDGVVAEQRLYQLVRQTGAVMDRTFEIQFLDPDVQAYAFTFG